MKEIFLNLEEKTGWINNRDIIWIDSLLYSQKQVYYHEKWENRKFLYYKREKDDFKSEIRVKLVRIMYYNYKGDDWR